jgi:hypothetical protein
VYSIVGLYYLFPYAACMYLLFPYLWGHVLFSHLNLFPLKFVYGFCSSFDSFSANSGAFFYGYFDFYFLFIPFMLI